MKKLIYKIAMRASKGYLTEQYSKEWYYKFSKESRKHFNEVIVKMPDIGKSIFSFQYEFAPAYIAWYLALQEMQLSKDEIDPIIWKINQKMCDIIPKALLHKAGKVYFRSFQRKAPKHIKKQNTTGVHPYDWQVEYRKVDRNCFEIDIKRCGMKKLAETFGAEGLLPGICRMDYMYANLMNNGFERAKTLADGDECCNCRYYYEGYCEWTPEKGFTDRK
ncbi:MAG: hypothetical protein E7256_14220 [Lachnospiraceae bacterium]|nr:hypothetical protein [Lachnospiraceae bacterium]